MADGIEPAKTKVIQLARAQTLAGAHYLWACAGNTPGNSDGAWYRRDKAQLHPNVPDLDGGLNTADNSKYKVYTPTLFAAFADDATGVFPCIGRTAKFDVPLALNLSMTSGAAFDLKLKDLTQDQFDELKQKARDVDKYRWPRPNDLLDNNALHHSTVWGESCVGKRHFDCIGFINWLLSEGLNQQIQFGVASYTGGKVGTEVAVKDAQAGDIVTINVDHIGMISERGTAIEADDKFNGVVEGLIGGKAWTQCFRLPPSTWK
jgi:NlpC/P60 family